MRRKLLLIPQKPRARTDLPNPLARLAPMPSTERMRVALKLLSAIDAIAAGRHPGKDDWNGICDAINVIDTLAVQGRVVVADGLISAAEQAMRDAARRHKEGRGMRFDGPGLQAVREVAGQYLWLADNWTEAQFKQAIRDTVERIRRALASGTVTSVEVQ